MRGPHTEKSGTNGIFISKSSPLKLTRRNEHGNDVIWITLFAALLRYIWSSWNLHSKAQMSLFTLHFMCYTFCKVSHFWCDLNYSYIRLSPIFIWTTFYKILFTSKSGFCSYMDEHWTIDDDLIWVKPSYFTQSTNLPIHIGCVNIKRKKAQN